MLNHHSDLNECMIDNGGCSQKCANNNGSFLCSCEDGFQLDIDGVTCTGTINLN